MTRTGATIAVALLALAGAAFWLLARGDGPSGGHEPSRPAAAPEEPRAPELPASVPDASEPLRAEDVRPATLAGAAGTAAADAVAAPGGSDATVLLGHVTRAGDGRPVAGVTVSARVTGEGPRQDASILTDADGAYRIELAHGGRLVRLEVGPGPATTRTTLRPDRELLPGADHVLDVEVTQGAALAGTVLDEAGRPVADAEVLAWTGARHTIRAERPDEPDRTVRTDSAGAFEVVAVGPRFVVSARAPGLVPSDALHGEIPVGKRATGLELHVSPERALRVEVRGADDRPLPDARVAARHRLAGASEQVTAFEGVFRDGPEEQDARTDADGRAVLRGLASLAYDVDVEHAAHVPWSGGHAPGDPDLLVRLARGGELSGTVVDAAARPLADAVVQLDSAADQVGDRNRRRATTGADGRFAFAGLVDDTQALLSVVAPGHAVRVMQDLPVSVDRPRELRVILGPQFALEGVVVDTHGAPVAGAPVAIEGERVIDFGGATIAPRPTWERMYHGLDVTRTGPDGAFRLDRLYQGAFRMRVSHPDDAAVVAVVDARSDGPPLHVVLDPQATVGVTLTGAVRDALTGRAVTEFSVTPMIPSGDGGMGGTGSTFRDEAGRFRVPGLGPGPIQVDVSASGYAPWSQPLRDYGEGLHVLDVALVPARTVRLRFVDPGRAPIEGAQVRFATVDARDLMVASGPGARTSVLVTDARGEVLAAELPADRIVVGLRRGLLDGGRVYTVDLRVPPPPVIELMVEDALKVELLVFVTAAETGASQGALGGVEGVLTLQSRLQDGTLSTLDVPAHVEARDASGAVVAEGDTDPDAGPDGHGGYSAAAAAVRLSVPREVLEVRITAPGHVPAAFDWTPQPGPLVGDMVAVTLVRS